MFTFAANCYRGSNTQQSENGIKMSPTLLKSSLVRTTFVVKFPGVNVMSLQLRKYQSTIEIDKIGIFSKRFDAKLCIF